MVRKRVCLVPFSVIISVILIFIFNVEAFPYYDRNLCNRIPSDKDEGVDLNNSIISDNFGKTVFLTFDDGPSEKNTSEILQILSKNNVKGSFFVIGSNVKANNEILKNIYCSGMAIFPHSYCHKYKIIYSDESNYFSDLEQCREEICKVIGNKDSFKFVRLPGGSLNTFASTKVLNNIKNQLSKRNIDYIDWNVSCGDAAMVKTSTSNIISNIEKYGDVYRIAVVLMHDCTGKENTVEALQQVIDFYKFNGYNFKTLDEMTSTEHEYLVKCRVINLK